MAFISPSLLPLRRLRHPCSSTCARLASRASAGVGTTTAPPLPNTLPITSNRLSQRAYDLDRCRVLASRGKTQEAREGFARLLEDHGENSEVLRSWGYMEAQQLGMEVISRDLFARAISAATNKSVEAAAWNAWALVEQRNGNTKTARKCFDNGMLADRTHAPLIVAYAVFEGRYGSKSKARELFSSAVALDRNSSRIWQAWASFEARDDCIPKARFLFSNAYRLAVEIEESIPVCLSWVRFEIAVKNFEKARSLLTEAVSTYGKHEYKILHAWANLEAHTRNFARATSLFRAALATPALSENPKLAAPTYQAWAISEKKQGKFENSRKLFEKAAETDPNHAYVWQAWGIAEWKWGNIDAARNLFEKGIQADPKSAPLYNAWARLEERNGNIEKARELFANALEAEQRHGHSLVAWAVLEGKCGNLEKARSLFKRALEIDPICAHAWQAWACMEENAGNFNQARTLFQKGVNANPSHIAVWQAWGKMEEKVGNEETGPACQLY